VSTQRTMRRLSTPITLILLLGLLAAGTWWGYKAVTAKVQAPLAPCVTVPMTELPTSMVTVNVYNGGQRAGLASTVAESLRTGGFIIGKVGNTDETVLTVVIIGSAEDNPEVQLVAAWFHDPVIQADQRVDHTVDVLVGNSFDDPEGTGMAAEPPSSLEVPSGEVCLPNTSTPTPTPTSEGEPGQEPEGEPGQEPADEPQPGDEPT